MKGDHQSSLLLACSLIQRGDKEGLDILDMNINRIAPTTVRSILAGLLWKGYPSIGLRESKNEALFHLRSVADLHDSYANFPGAVWIKHDPDGRRLRSHTFSDLLYGDLEVNRNTPIYRSFFKTPLREVNVFHLVGEYLNPFPEGEEAKKRDRDQIIEFSLSGMSCGTPIYKAVFLESFSSSIISINGEEDPSRNIFLPLLPLNDMNTLVFACERSTDLSCLAEVPCLFEEVYLEGNLLSDASHLGTLSLVNLRELIIFETRIRDLSFLSTLDMRSLEVVKVEFSPLDSISFLSSLPKGARLKALSFQSTNVKDLSPLRDIDLSELEELTLTFTAVSDLSPLEGLNTSNLKYLRLMESEVSDVTSFSSMNLNSLIELDLSCTRVVNISPLVSCFVSGSLEKLGLQCTLVRDISVLEGVQNIDKCVMDLKGTPVGCSSPSPPSWMSGVLWGSLW